MGKSVLIITNSHDLHADLVQDRISRRGAPVFRLDLDAFPRDFDLSLSVRDGRWGGGLCHLPSGRYLSVGNIGAVWLRKRGDYAFPGTDLSAQERAFATDEVEHIVFSLLYSLDCYWMSHPLAIRGAMWKGEQLLRASRMGFAVPTSLISNSPGSVGDFRRGLPGGMVFKTLSSPFLGADKVPAEERGVSGLPTTLVTEEHDDILDSVRELPGFFQSYVDKAHELRVTVIGERVFAARIHSQADDRTRIDYRDYSAEILYEAAELPAGVETFCRDFVRSYGLAYGAIDLIVRPDGGHVFLENNPVGQFLFVEQLIPEFRMLDAVADCLIVGAGN